MQGSPYSIYVDKRPLKIAFLIDADGDASLVDRIIAYNHGKWGGRYNPIILCNGNEISDNWWSFLSAYDPDVIKSYVTLSDQVIEKIHRFLSPYRLEVPRDQSDTEANINILEDGLSILPTLENVARFYHSPLFKAPNLALFEIDKSADQLLSSFIRNNFGTYVPMQRIDESLSQNVVQRFKIDNRASFYAAFEQLSNGAESFVFPAQMCSIPNTFPVPEIDYSLSESFTVIVGESLRDIAYAWNRALLIPSYDRSVFSQVWLPTKFAFDESIDVALKKWLQRAADPAGTTNRRINFTSFSLDERALQDIARRLTEGSWLHLRTQVLREHPVPVYSSRFFKIHDGMDLYRAVSEEENIVLREPEVEQGVMGGESWVADLYIEFKSEVFKHITGPSYWYKFPKKNTLASYMLNRPSRIGANGLPSVIMRRSSMASKRENELRIRLLSDDTILRSLVLGDAIPYDYKDDPRARFASRSYAHAVRSDKGKYLSGFLELFSGLYPACKVLERRYWRRMFDTLSAQDSMRDEDKRQNVVNWLNKQPIESRDTPTGTEWLADKILQMAKTISASGKELRYEYFVQEAAKESDEYNSQQEHKIEFNPSDLRDEITHLMEQGILIAGIRPHCPYCGIANWYKADDLHQTLECTGCNRDYPLQAEAEWYYKLNHLILSGYAYHGLAPVVLVLGQMIMDSRASMMISPSLCLYDGEHSGPVCELDILCVQDGKFVIGEVKSRVRLFHHSDFEKAKTVAQRLRPDKVIFSSLDPKPSKRVSGEIETLKNELAPMSIEVEWYHLPDYLFKPSPVR